MGPQWSSYDDIAETYASVAERLYFAAPARDLVSLLQLREPAAVLDIGTGSGVVAAALEAIARGSVFACDQSVPMLRISQKRLPNVRFAAAALPQIPFQDHTFHAVTLGFVLSHVPDVVGALVEIKRILKIGGRIALSSWSLSPAASNAGRAWQVLTTKFVSADALEAATTRALPSEELLGSSQGPATALRKAGFADVQIEQRTYSIECGTDEFIQSRLLSIPSRYMVAHLSRGEWQRFLAEVNQTLPDQFGQKLRFETSCQLVTATARAG